MEIFINESSLEGQYHNQVEFVKGIKEFIALFSFLKKVKNKALFKEDLLIYESAIRGENFQASFQKTGNKDIKNAFRGIIFNRLNPKNWRKEQVHSTEHAYFFIEGAHFEDVTNKTLAEIAERNLQDQEKRRLAVNFIASRFQSSVNIPIYKDDENTVPILVDCCDKLPVLENWVGDIDISAVDFLKDTTRFTPSSKISTQGTRIYQEIETNYYWHFDNFHDYISFEVYNKQGTHIGVADIAGIIDLEKAVEGRSISNIL